MKTNPNPRTNFVRVHAFITTSLPEKIQFEMEKSSIDCEQKKFTSDISAYIIILKDLFFNRLWG